ncbi:hypothetical protein [Streptomyces sp. NPDC018957]|uniref:hypothetical protein n=1 Tax=Streptomyces sp. NPDC018957 TaxID=3365056 RepID=UPI0037947CF0
MTAGSVRSGGPTVAAASLPERRSTATTPTRTAPTVPPVLTGTRRRTSRRRAALLAAAGVAVAGGMVAAMVLAMAPGDRDDGTRDGAYPAPPSYGSHTTAVTDGTGGPSPSVSPSPSPTVQGTSRPRTLPPGAQQEAGGYAWVPPEGWRRDFKTGAEVHYTSPDGKQELVAKSSLARGDLMETWRTSEQNAHQGQDYRKIRLEETTFRGNPAVVWEYTFTLRGTHWHARLLGFNQNGKSYQINTWYQPEIEMAALSTYEKVRDSFTVL